MPDIRQPLAQLHEEWSNCTSCTLGVHRQLYHENFVFGEGTTRSVMFIGDGPTEQEAREGRPLADCQDSKRGEVFHKVLRAVGLQDFYVTNLVSCRSCEPWLDQEGQPIFRKQRGGPPLQMFRDRHPEPSQWKACLPRLHEEIYRVDPVLIVTLGGAVTEALLGHKGAVGKVECLSVPGALQKAVLTDKLQAWHRKQEGVLRAPTKQNEVLYSLLPTLAPSYVADLIEDRSAISPFNRFYRDMSMAAKIYRLYCREVMEAATNALDNELPENIRASIAASTTEDY